MTLMFDPQTPDDIRLSWLHAGTTGVLQEAQQETTRRLQEIHQTANSMPFVKAAQIVAHHWPTWGPKLLSAEKTVDIDLTPFADDPDKGQGGEHILWINAILVMLSSRPEGWAQTWMPGRRWIARFGPRRKTGELALPRASLAMGSWRSPRWQR